tara:strand:- start:96 stop:857 length:762 start_codon:yes stop_codon:yes gene_type:complete
MHGKNKTICIAGKNKCAIICLSYVIKKFKGYKILALPNKSDTGVDNWQKSFKKYSKKNKIQITSLKKLYKIKNLIFFSLEYEELLNINKFKSKELFNIHFSLLPRYRGCHTTYYQIKNGEKRIGVTLHKIDSGIDTGDIVDKKSFKVFLNSTAYENYLKLLNSSIIIFKKNINKILKKKYTTKKQNLKKGSYFSKKSVNYKKICNFKKIDNNLVTHNKIRSLIFQPFQLPMYNGNKIKKTFFKNKKIKLLYTK